MTPKYVSERVILDRLKIIEQLLNQIKSLPLDDQQAFFADSRNVWAAESCLRRSLEALLEIGRHILAKGFAIGVTEYKEIAVELGKHKVLSNIHTALLHKMAGYRNRMVHLYHEVTPEELFRICNENLNDVAAVGNAFRQWLLDNPDKVNPNL